MATMDRTSVVGWIAAASFLVLAASAPLAAQGNAASGWSMPPEDTLVLPKAPAAQDVVKLSQIDETVRVSVSGLYNRHLATRLTTAMGGATVYVAGQFLRDQKTAYLVLSSTRFRVPLFFNLRGLLENEVNIAIGGTNYKIFLDWSVRGLMQAQVKIQPDGGSVYAVTLQDLLDSTFAAGERVDIGGQEHRLAYYSEITGSPQGALDANRRTYALMSNDPKDPSTYFTYVFPEEDLASGGEHTYTFPNNPIRTMKVSLSGGVLQIHALR